MSLFTEAQVGAAVELVQSQPFDWEHGRVVNVFRGPDRVMVQWANGTTRIYGLENFMEGAKRLASMAGVAVGF